MDVTKPLLVAALMLAHIVAGCCGPATMSAQQARAPVLLGPVWCIGCAPQPPRVLRGPPILNAEAGDEMTINVITAAAHAFHFHRQRVPSTLATMSNRVLGTPCTGDIRISHMAAVAFGIGASTLQSTSLVIRAEGMPVWVPRASCVRVPPAGVSGPADKVAP